MNRLDSTTGTTDNHFYIPRGISELNPNRGTTLTNSERGIDSSEQLTYNGNGTELLRNFSRGVLASGAKV